MRTSLAKAPSTERYRVTCPMTSSFLFGLSSSMLGEVPANCPDFSSIDNGLRSVGQLAGLHHLDLTQQASVCWATRWTPSSGPHSTGFGLFGNSLDPIIWTPSPGPHSTGFGLLGNSLDPIIWTLSSGPHSTGFGLLGNSLDPIIWTLSPGPHSTGFGLLGNSLDPIIWTLSSGPHSTSYGIGNSLHPYAESPSVLANPI